MSQPFYTKNLIKMPPPSYMNGIVPLPLSISNLKNESTICLNMIVKDESHIIEETLKKLINKIKIDYWIISDTGSSDNTPEIIQKFFKERNIPGELYHDEWRDFGYNRSKALEYAYNKSDYLLIFDADDEINGDIVIPKLLIKDGYYFKFGNSEFNYVRKLLVNNRLKWKFVGVLHEVLMCDEKDNIDTDIINGNYYTVSGKSGNRSKDPLKYKKDAEILEKSFTESFNKNDKIYERYAFYCANSYRDAGMYEESNIWYKKVLTMNNWEQEKYISCYRIFLNYKDMNKIEEGFYWLVSSNNYDSERLECIFELIVHYCVTDRNDLSYLYYKLIKNYYENYYINYGDNCLVHKLFVNKSIYDLKLPYYMIIVCDRVKDRETGLKMYKMIFTRKYINFEPFLIGNLLFNLQFFINDIKKDDKKEFIDLFQGYIQFLLDNKFSIQTYDFLGKQCYLDIGFDKYLSQIKRIFSEDECKNSKKILFYTGYCDKLWNYTYSISNPLGGSETAVAQLTKYFPEEYEIYILGSVQEEKINNITYINLNNTNYINNILNENAFHTVIVSRYLDFFENYNICYYQSYIWAHDIILLNYGCNLTTHEILIKWNNKITGCICQTQWHENLFKKQYPLLNDKFISINNGITTDLFIEKPIKKQNRFIYTSCTERGLKKLLELWVIIIDLIPDAELIISTYNHFPRDDEERKMEEFIKKTPSIKHLGSLRKKELYEVISTAEYWVYPSLFNETSCITSMEMLASDVICLYYPVAGLENTLGDYGFQMEQGKEIDKIMEVINMSQERKEEIKKRGKEYSNSCSWNERTKMWCSTIFTPFLI